MGKKARAGLRVLHAPVNYANQAYLLSRALRGRGVDSVQLRYRFPSQGFQFYDDDERVVQLTNKDWYGDMLRTVQQVASEEFDIIHLWNRTLLHWRPGDIVNGMDLPFLRLSGARLAFRFTGYDLRRKSLEVKLNRFSPYHYGFKSDYDEDDQKRYVDSIFPYIDEFVVQDPEMQTYFPEARVIPRAIDLENFPVTEQPSNQRPLIVHAPSNKQVKGSDFVLKAVAELKAEGLDFDFQMVEHLPNAEALDLYRRADIVIDQLLIGWYGVLAMEGMAMGKAVIAYIRDDLLGYFTNDMPLINANPDNITSVLRATIQDRDLRGEIGRRARAFVESVHDSRNVVRAAVKMYRQMLKAPGRRIVPDFVYQLHGSFDFRERFDGDRLRWSQNRVAQLQKETAAHLARIAALEAKEQTRPAAPKTETKTESQPAKQPATEANGRASGNTMEGEIAALKSALIDAVYESARSETLAAEAAALRHEAQRWRAAEAEMAVLREAAERWRSIEAALPILRQNAERYLVLEPQLPELQFKATRCGELQDEVVSLRYKALRYDEVRDQLAGWRNKAERYDTMMGRSVIGRILWALGIGRRKPGAAGNRKSAALKPAE